MIERLVDADAPALDRDLGRYDRQRIEGPVHLLAGVADLVDVLRARFRGEPSEARLVILHRGDDVRPVAEGAELIERHAPDEPRGVSRIVGRVVGGPALVLRVDVEVLVRERPPEVFVAELPVALVEPLVTDRGIDLDAEPIFEEKLEGVEQIGLMTIDERPHPRYAFHSAAMRSRPKSSIAR